MQPNEITLPVDELNDGNTVNRTFSRSEYFQNRSLYISPGHNSASRDTLGMYRTYPKQSGNFRGTDKTSVKFTTDIPVLGIDGISSIKAPLIVEVSFSIPVGVAAADVLIARQKAVALLDSDEIMDALNIQLIV